MRQRLTDAAVRAMAVPAGKVGVCNGCGLGIDRSVNVEHDHELAWLELAKVAGYREDAPAYLRILATGYVSREAMERAWFLGEDLRERGLPDEFTARP